MQALLYGVPVLVGFVLGYFLAWPVLVLISVGIIAFAGWMVWTTKDAEIGAFIGVIVAFEAGIGLVSMWVTMAVIYGVTAHIDLHWLFR